MIDKRIGRRIKERREQLGLTQAEFAEQLGVATNYISTIERGASFPRCEKLIAILNGLETSADAIFCDVLDYSAAYQASTLSERLRDIPAREQKRILEVVDLMIRRRNKTADADEKTKQGIPCFAAAWDALLCLSANLFGFVLYK